MYTSLSHMLCDASILMDVHKAFRKLILFYISANFPLSSYQNTSFLVSPINSSFRRIIICFRFNSAIYLITFQFPERRFPSLIRTPFSCSLGRIRLIVPIVIPVWLCKACCVILGFCFTATIISFSSSVSSVALVVISVALVVISVASVASVAVLSSLGPIPLR